MPPHYEERDIEAIGKASTFEDLLKIALGILARMPKGAYIVCGPISTGGLGSKEKNVEVLSRAAEKLIAEGKNIFSQIPFEEAMWRIMKTPYYKGGNHLLESFYLPLFESGYIKGMFFIPGWEESNGASWEHSQGERLGLEMTNL